jgi:DNA-binding transcriptional regulator WhiA
MKKDIALVAGIVASDGHLDKDFHIIRIVSGSSNFVEFLKQKLQKISKEEIRIYISESGYGKTKYVIYINDKILYQTLNEKFNIPKGKKSSIIEPPNNLDQEEESSYIEGWFAGEGSISHDKNPQIALWSKSEKMIRWLSEKIKEKGIIPQIYYSKKKQQYLLMIRRKKDFLSFVEKFNFIHPDKKSKLVSILERPRIRTS